MSSLRVLIVGASIAGPSAAYWFARAGASVTVIERFPSLRTGGQNVDIRSVGVTVMRKIPGMEAAVQAKAAPMEGIRFVRADGSEIGTIRPTGNPEKQSLVSEYEIYRGDLSRILYDLTSENERVTYVFGEQVASLHYGDEKEQDGPVTVEFANGYPTAEYDLVVACDGSNSRTRAIGFGGGPRDYIEPTNSWAAWFSMHRDLVSGSRLGHSYSAPGGRFMATSTDPDGTSRGAFLSFGTPSESDSVASFRQALAEGQDSVKRFIAQHFSGTGWKADDLVESMVLADDFHATELIRVKTPRLSHGRVVLVGDAGYASGAGGVGTSLAMTGGYILAGEVMRRPGDLPTALKNYEEKMRPIINDLQDVSPLVGAMLAPQTAWGLRARNLVLGAVCKSQVLSLAQKLPVQFFAGEEKHKVPGYAWPDDSQHSHASGKGADALVKA